MWVLEAEPHAEGLTARAATEDGASRRIVNPTTKGERNRMHIGFYGGKIHVLP